MSFSFDVIESFQEEVAKCNPYKKAGDYCYGFSYSGNYDLTGATSRGCPVGYGCRDSETGERDKYSSEVHETAGRLQCCRREPRL